MVGAHWDSMLGVHLDMSQWTPTHFGGGIVGVIIENCGKYILMFILELYLSNLHVLLLKIVCKNPEKRKPMDKQIQNKWKKL